jgi:predicted RNase H-like HicB family nuclease
MDHVYAAILEPNDDGSYTVTFPDLPGCISEGKDLPDALRMAERALSQRIEYMEDKGLPSPDPTSLSKIKKRKDALASLIRAGRKDNRATRRTVSIPKWMDEQASKEGLSLSRVLQEALQTKLTT